MSKYLLLAYVSVVVISLPLTSQAQEIYCDSNGVCSTEMPSTSPDVPAAAEDNPVDATTNGSVQGGQGQLFCVTPYNYCVIMGVAAPNGIECHCNLPGVPTTYGQTYNQ